MKGFVLGHEMKKTFIPECLKSVIEVSKDSTHNYTTIILEFVYQGKVNSVPEGETPFPRNQTGNIVAVVQWGKDDDSPEKLKSAKNAVNEISKLMPKGGGYSNYSGSLVVFSLNFVLTSIIGPDSDTLPKEGTEDPNKTQNIFKDNYPRLQAIKRKYDPNVVFDKWFVVDPTPA